MENEVLRFCKPLYIQLSTGFRVYELPIQSDVDGLEVRLLINTFQKILVVQIHESKKETTLKGSLSFDSILATVNDLIDMMTN